MPQLVSLFINHLSAEEKAANTTEHYTEVLERFESWLHSTHRLSLNESDVRQINGMIMVEYYQSFYQRQLKTSTRNNYTVVLKKFFKFLLEVGAILEDPTRMLHCIKLEENPEEDEDKEYTPEQLKALLKLLSDPKIARNSLRDSAMVALMLGSGLRASEVCSLDVSDSPAIKSGMITCKRKGRGYKTVEVADFVWPYIDR